MDGIHDMGGMHGFGPVLAEENVHEDYAEWEHRTFALILLLSRAGHQSGVMNIDEMRHGIERLHPADYLASSYFVRWQKSIECLLLEKGVITSDEVAERMALLRERPDASAPESRPLIAVAPVRAAIGVPTTPPLKTAPGFSEGDTVIARNIHPVGHTRLPRYVRGKQGLIHKFQGVFILPDAHAHGQGEQSQPLYSVRFEAGDLWSTSSEPRQAVYIDLWESYLEPATHS